LVDSLVTGVPVGSFFFAMNQSSESLDELRGVELRLALTANGLSLTQA